jgi:hypothetical protein
MNILITSRNIPRNIFRLAKKYIQDETPWYQQTLQFCTIRFHRSSYENVPVRILTDHRLYWTLSRTFSDLSYEFREETLKYQITRSYPISQFLIILCSQ